MFYLVAAIECLAVNFLVWLCASLLCLPASRLVLKITRHRHPGTVANSLFAVRVLPAALATILAVIFALPAFLLFEPRPSNDYVGPLQIAIAASGGLIYVIMIFRAARSLRASWMVEKYWKARSHRIQLPGVDAPAYSVNGIPSLFVVTGTLRPCVFVGREIIEELSAEEMAAAARHEMAHIRSRDNLKQLLLDISRPPAWLMRLGIHDEVWMDTAELAADHSTLSAGNAPLQLASALLKVGRLRSSFAAHFAASGAHLVPTHCSPRLETRVTHLIALADEGFDSRLQQFSRRMLLALAITGTVIFILSYAATASVMLKEVEEALDVLF